MASQELKYSTKCPHGYFYLGSQKFKYIRPPPDDPEQRLYEPVEPVSSSDDEDERIDFSAVRTADFSDAQEMHSQKPDTFSVPSPDELQAICAGAVVKVCHNNERFWVVVKKVQGDELVGRVDNALVLPHPFSGGDLIRFKKAHIYQIN